SPELAGRISPRIVGESSFQKAPYLAHRFSNNAPAEADSNAVRTQRYRCTHAHVSRPRQSFRPSRDAQYARRRSTTQERSGPLHPDTEQAVPFRMASGGRCGRLAYKKEYSVRCI